jgi:DNA-binding MarR family transcriptional regulator
MDDDIALIYRLRGIATVRPRFSMALIRLQHRGPMTVRELAAQIDVTHSAMSQTITAMKKDGLVDSSPGVDARTRTIELTEAGRSLVPFLEAEWRATEAALAELDAEIPYALTRVIQDLRAALAATPFHQRIAAHLDDDGQP